MPYISGYSFYIIDVLNSFFVYLQHQAQVVAAMERAKQVTNADLAVSYTLNIRLHDKTDYS